MRTVEVTLGLLVIVAAVALALGAARLFAPITSASLGQTLTLAALGATLAAHGMSGRKLRRGLHDRSRFWRAAFYVLLVITLITALPLVVDILDLFTVAGFPIGYYMASQGLLILLAILSFRAATHLDALDNELASPPPREEV
jgi:putative solute:sodium symporter small subunit